MLSCNLHFNNFGRLQVSFQINFGKCVPLCGMGCVPLTKTPKTPAMPSNEKEGKRVDSGSKLSWRCFSGLGLSWCTTDGPPTEAWGLYDSVPRKEREMLAPRLALIFPTPVSPTDFPRILLGAKPERGPTEVSCDLLLYGRGRQGKPLRKTGQTKQFRLL